MLTINAGRIFKMRGLSGHLIRLVRAKITRRTAHGFLDGSAKTVKLKHLEKMCLLLNCTPNDLFDWKPDEESNPPESHSLYSLRKNVEIKNFSEKLKDVPIEKLKEINQFIEDMKQK